MEDTQKKPTIQKWILVPKNLTFWFSRKDINTGPHLKAKNKTKVRYAGKKRERKGRKGERH